MSSEQDRDLEQLIVDTLRDASTETATPATIKGLLPEHQNARPATEDVRSKADELVEEDLLEIADEDEEGEPRYRLTDSDSKPERN